MTQGAPAAFFSYSRADSEFALRLAEDLKAAGANVWLDQLDIAPGERWARAVQKALNISPRVMVILSPASVSSNHVEDEVNFALDEQKTVIPILYQDCAVPFRLRPLQYVDFRTDYARALKVTLKTLNPEQSTPAISDAPRQYQADTIGADKGERAAEEEREKAEAQQAREEAEGRKRAEAERKAREQAEEAEARQRAEARRKGRKKKAEQERRRAEGQEALEQEEVEEVAPVAADNARIVEEQPTDQAPHETRFGRRISKGIGGLSILLVGWGLWRVSNDKSWGVFFTMIFLFGLTGCWLLWEAITGKK